MKQVVQGIFVVAVILCLAVPVAADGSFFVDFWSWLKSFITGAQTVDPDGDGIDFLDNCADVYNPGQEDVDQDNIGDVCDFVYSVSPSVLAQGASASIRILGNNLSNISFPSSITVLNQSVVNDSAVDVLVSVGVFADVGHYSVVGDVLGIDVVDGPLDLLNVSYYPENVTSGSVNFSVNVSVAENVNPALISLSGAYIYLLNNVTNVSFVLNLTNSTLDNNTFVLSFESFTFGDGDFELALHLSYGFAESFSPSVQIDEVVDLAGFVIQQFPALCLNIIPLPLSPFCCPGGSVCPFPLTVCGNHLMCRAPDPGAGTVPATPVCALGNLCTVANIGIDPAVPVCDFDYGGVPGAACSTDPNSACIPPYKVGRCFPVRYSCPAPLSGSGGDFAIPMPVGAPPLPGTVTCASPKLSTCGNNILEAPEWCDNGVNNVDCSPLGCNANCYPEECGNLVLCSNAPYNEVCDPPGNTVQCPGGSACKSDCTCPSEDVHYGGGGGFKNEEYCVPLCLPDGSVSWNIVSIDGSGKVLPANPVHMASFKACLEQTGQFRLSRPDIGLNTFTLHQGGAVYRLGQLPKINELRNPDDAAFFKEAQQNWLQKIAGSKAEVDSNPVPFCPAPQEQHINVFLRAECNVASNPRVFIDYGWTHFTDSDDDIIDVQRLIYFVDDVETVVDIGCDVEAENCDKKLELELPSLDADFKAVILVKDILGVEKFFEIEELECVSCPPAELMGKRYANPCCTGKVTKACCDDEKNFLQDKLISAPTSSCYMMSTMIGGPEQNVCLADMATCDIASPYYLKGSNIYQQFGWSENVVCGDGINPFTQALKGVNFEKALNACPPVDPCSYPSRIAVGFNFGECRETVWECNEKGIWEIDRMGVNPSSEKCNRLDDNCNGLIDEGIYCSCSFVGQTRPCTSFTDTKAVCYDAIGALLYDNRPCYEDWYGPQPKPDVLVAQPAEGQFAVKSQGAFGVPCGDGVFPFCEIYDKETDGPVKVSYWASKRFGGIIAGAVVAELPGYVHLASYELDNCDDGDVEIALNVPPLKDFVAVFKRGEESVVLPSALGVSAGLAGYDVQELFDKATIPVVSYAKVKEGVVLAPSASTLSALGITADFTGGIKGVKVSLETAGVKVKDKALAVVGQPLKFVFDNPKPIGVTIRAQLVMRDNIDPNSLGFYVYRENKWNYVGGRISNDFFVVSLDDVMPLLENDSLTFMIAGSVCDGCVKPYLFTVRDVDSPLLVVLVHGLFSSPSQSWSALLKEFEDEDVNVDVAVFSYSGSPVPDAVRALSEELHKKDYGKIVFITHSLGGLVVREFLHEEEQKPDSLIPKIEAFIMAGVPNQGTPITSTVKKVFELGAWLLDRADNAPIMGAHPETLDLVTNGLQYPAPSSVKVFSLVGTRDESKSGLLFGLPVPNDGIVTVESAKRLDGVVLEDSCVNELEQSVGHLMVNSGSSQRYTLLYFLRRLSSEFNERAPPQMYAALRIDNCQSGVLEVYGRLLNVSALPPPEGCDLCGNGVCEFGENCPSDCVAPEKQVAFGGYPFARVLDILLAVNLLLIILYHVKSWKFQKVLRYCIYALAVLALPLFALGYGSFISVMVYVLVILLIFIDVLFRTNSFYRWH